MKSPKEGELTPHNNYIKNRNIKKLKADNANGFDKLLKKQNKGFVRDIYLLTGFPGIGKTFEILKFINNHPEKRIILLSESHEILTEFEEGITREYTHWRGFSELCKVKNYKRIQEKTGINPSFFCKLCNKTDCPYKNQFEDKKNLVLAPLSYLYTGRIKEFKPDIIFVEENPFSSKIVRKPDYKIINRQLDIFEKNYKHYKYLPREFKNLSFEEDMMELYIDYHKAIMSTIQGYFAQKIKNSEKPSALFKEMLKILKQTPDEIATYFRYCRRYGKQEAFSVPLQFYLFDLAFEQRTNILISDATVNNELLDELSARYYREHNDERLINFEEIQLNNGRKKRIDSKIIRIYPEKNPDAWYPLQSLGNTITLDLIARDIREIARINNLKRVCIITFQTRIINLKLRLENEFEVEFMHFGNLRSSNKFMNEKIGFIVGTYSVNKEDILEEYKTTFPFYRDNNEEPKRAEKSKRFVFNNESIDSLRKTKEDDEMYQAINRFRPLLKPTTIYIYGEVPDRIYDLIEVEKISREELRRRLRSERIKKGLKNNKIDYKKELDEIFKKRTEIAFQKIVELLKQKYGIGEVKLKRELNEEIRKSDEYEIETKVKKVGRPSSFVKRR